MSRKHPCKRLLKPSILGVLLLSLACLLGACQGAPAEPGGQTGAPASGTAGDLTDPDTDVRDPVTLTLAEKGVSSFSIVYPRSAGTSLKRAASRLADLFRQKGVQVEVGHDGGALSSKVPTDTCEILLGRTNRAESKAALTEALPKHGYRTFATDKRMGVVATDEAQLELAALSWIGEMINGMRNGDLTVELKRNDTVDWDNGNREKWLLYGIPAYEGGTLSSKLYDCGYGMTDYSEQAEDNSAMQMVYGTTAAEMDAYLEKLERAGYRKTFTNTIGDNRYAACELGGVRLYVYYTAAEEITRVILDKSGDSIDEFGYRYVPTAQDETVLYAYALCQSPTGLDSNNCGQLDVIKLADNSLFVIDGGMEAQFDQAAIDGFVDFCHRVTGVPKGKQVRIACWFFTHDHGDHRDGLAQVLGTSQYLDDFMIERLAFNFPATSVGVNGTTKSFLSRIASLYPACKMLKLHTGMKLQLADMQIEVVTTHENLTNRQGESLVRDFNNTSTVLKLTAGGVSFLLLGDTDRQSAEAIVARMPASFLKSDIVQVAHHTWNDIGTLYDVAQAKYAIFTQTEGASNRTLGIHAKAVLLKVQQYAAPEHCYYSGVETTGLLLKNGAVSVKETFPLAWNTPDYPWTYVYEGWDMSKVKDYSYLYS